MSFEAFEQALDTTPLHWGLPDDSCLCPHWGYVLAGLVGVVYKDREELLRAGAAMGQHRRFAAELQLEWSQ